MIRFYVILRFFGRLHSDVNRCEIRKPDKYKSWLIRTAFVQDIATSLEPVVLHYTRSPFIASCGRRVRRARGLSRTAGVGKIFRRAAGASHRRDLRKDTARGRSGSPAVTAAEPQPLLLYRLGQAVPLADRDRDDVAATPLASPSEPSLAIFTHQVGQIALHCTIAQAFASGT